MVFDVSDEAQCKALVDKTIERFGKIDILINNAALYAPLPTLKVTEIDVELWDKVMGINIRGPFLMVKHTAPHMIAKKYGKIVNIGSGTVARGIPDFSHYVTSKGAVTAFTRCISRELGGHGICVNTLAPGYTLSDTGLTNTVHVEQSKAAAIAAPRLKRDQFPEDLLGTPDLPVFQRQRLHDRPGAGGRWRRQQHLSLIPGQSAPAPLFANTACGGQPLPIGRENHMSGTVMQYGPVLRGGIPRRNSMSVATLDPKHNVTGNRQAYYDKISKKDMAPLWEVLRNVVTKEPKSKCAPNVWHFDDIKKLMLEAGDVISAEEAERRVLVLENPSLRGQSRITNRCSPASSSSCRARPPRRTSTFRRRSASCSTARAPTPRSRARRPTCRAATSS